MMSGYWADPLPEHVLRHAGHFWDVYYALGFAFSICLGAAIGIWWSLSHD